MRGRGLSAQARQRSHASIYGIEGKVIGKEYPTPHLSKALDRSSKNRPDKACLLLLTVTVQKRLLLWRGYYGS